MTGYGSGGLLLTPDTGAALEAGLSMGMAAAGTRGEIVAGGAGGFGLAFKADALWVGTGTDGLDGPAGRMDATEAAVTRFRTALDGSRDFLLAGRMSLAPSVEVGLRHDGGDAETGAGMDVGVGVILVDMASGLAVDLRVRTLLVHQSAGFSERGIRLYAERPLDVIYRFSAISASMVTNGPGVTWLSPIGTCWRRSNAWRARSSVDDGLPCLIGEWASARAQLHGRSGGQRGRRRSRRRAVPSDAPA